MQNKRGWAKMLETVIAILLISSVLIITYSKQTNQTDQAAYVSDIQDLVLKDISLDPNLRSIVLNSTSEESIQLNDFAREKIPPQLNFSLKVCNLTNPPTPCKLSSSTYLKTRNIEVFAKEIIISADYDKYNPKKVKLFVWEV